MDRDAQHDRDRTSAFEGRLTHSIDPIHVVLSDDRGNAGRFPRSGGSLPQGPFSSQCVVVVLREPVRLVPHRLA